MQMTNQSEIINLNKEVKERLENIVCATIGIVDIPLVIEVTNKIIQDFEKYDIVGKGDLVTIAALAGLGLYLGCKGFYNTGKAIYQDIMNIIKK